MGFGARHQGFQRVVVQPLQHQHLHARQQRAVQLERGILRGGPDQDDGAVLHIRQEPVLLGAVEAVDLVDEQQRALARVAPGAGGVEHPAQVGHAGEHRGNLLEHQPAHIGQQAGDGGLAGARRAPEHQRGQLAGRHHAAERAVRTQQVVLAHHVGQPFGSQPVGQRPGRVVVQTRRLEQISHGVPVPRIVPCKRPSCSMNRHAPSGRRPPFDLLLTAPFGNTHSALAVVAELVDAQR